jgi:hypothetical protein
MKKLSSAAGRPLRGDGRAVFAALLVLGLAFTPLPLRADEPGPMQKTGEKLDAWGHKVGEAVGKAAAKTGTALDKAAHKTGEKLDAWGHKIKEKLSN